MNDGPHWLDVEREQNRRRVKALEDSRDEWRRLYDKAEIANAELTAQLRVRNTQIAELEETNARQLRELADADAEIARLRGTL